MDDPTSKTIAELLADGHTVTIAPPAAPIAPATPAPIEPSESRPITDPAEIAELERIAAQEHDQDEDQEPETRQVKVRRGGRVRVLDKPA